METRDSLQDSFTPVPDSWISFANSHLGVPAQEAASRAQRAWRAGQWARAVLDGRVGTPNRTPTVAQRNRIWCVVRAACISSPRVFTTSATFHQAVGPLEGSDTICHAFPSQAEGRIYFAGAGLEYPA